MEKLFTLTKSDMEVGYQCAQGAHMVAQWLLDNPNQTWNNETLVMLEADDLDLWKFKLNTLGIPYSQFIEPDIGYVTTSIAVLGNDKLFKKLKLVGWRYANNDTAAMVA